MRELLAHATTTRFERLGSPKRTAAHIVVAFVDAPNERRHRPLNIAAVAGLGREGIDHAESLFDGCNDDTLEHASDQGFRILSRRTRGKHPP